MNTVPAHLAIGIEMAVRGLLVALFLPFSALDKLLNFGAAVDQASERVAWRPLARSFVVTGFCIEVGMSAAVVSGIADRFAALMLAGYCAATALLWKRFWRTADFALVGHSRGRDVFWDFLKNLALAGGFLILAFGPDAAGVRDFLKQPFASSHPYSIEP
jgi:putative oxidoreductase